MRKILKIPKRYTIKKSGAFSNPRSLRSRVAIAVLSLIAVVSMYFLAAPFLPRLAFWLTRPRIDPSGYQQAAEATKKGITSNPISNKPGNRLILPSIGLDTQIIEGRNIYVISKNQGVWNETSSLNPSKPGNMVVAGHRWIGYDIRNVGQFYNLPELKVGSKIYIQWQNKTYAYEVYHSRSVEPTQIDIRDADPKVPNKLTMYTCYPLGSIAKRFVIEAKQL